MDTPTFREKYFTNQGADLKLNLDQITEKDSENRSENHYFDQYYSPNKSTTQKE